MRTGFPRTLALLLLSIASLAQAQPFFLPTRDPKPTDKVWVKVENMSDEFDEISLDAF